MITSKSSVNLSFIVEPRRMSDHFRTPRRGHHELFKSAASSIISLVASLLVGASLCGWVTPVQKSATQVQKK